MKTALSPFLLRQLLFGKLTLLAAGMNLFSLNSYSQAPGRPETLAYINRNLGQAHEVSMKQGNIVVKSLNGQGQTLREDRVACYDLELPVYFETESRLLCIPCAKDAPDCVTRSLSLQKVKSSYGRLSIPLTNEAQFRRLKKAFDHLIRICAEEGYKNEVTLD